MAKISWRLLPLIVVVYFVAYIDRTNVGFAASAMNKDLGFTPYVYGWGAGIFFLGYFLFEVPSNVILHRVGARVWIARIMVTWGIVSGLMMFITGPASFMTVRFLLGVAEAGFFPGVLLYFTYWFPAAYRARVVSALFPRRARVERGCRGAVRRDPSARRHVGARGMEVDVPPRIAPRDSAGARRAGRPDRPAVRGHVAVSRRARVARGTARI